MTRELSPKAGAALLKKAFANKNASLTHTEALNILAQLKGFEAWSHLQQAGKKKPQAAADPSARRARKLTLVDVLRDHYGVWGDYSALPREDWRYEVGNNDTGLGYWDWVVHELHVRDLYTGLDEFEPMPACEVTLPDGRVSTWNLEGNLTDRWGSFNDNASVSKPGKVILELDEALALDDGLTDKLRQQMWDEYTFIVRKDGVFGLLYEVEYSSRESEEGNAPADALADYKPHSEVVTHLLNGLKVVAKAFPSIEMCVPDAAQVIYGRPAVWAFVPLDALAEEQRAALGLALSQL